MAHNEVTRFMWYMFNKWCKNEAIRIFGENLGNHIWDKWSEIIRFGCGDNLYFYAQLDNDCRQKLVDRANEVYK